MQTFTLTLESVDSITPNVKHFTCSCSQPDFRYIPGQFITIHFEHQGHSLKRSYSIATISGTSNLIEFAAGFVEQGPASQLLFNLKPGDKLTTSGPFGRLILKPEEIPQRYLLIATSTGITPYRAMLPLLKERLASQKFQVVVLQGVQNKQDLLYQNDFLEMARNHDNFKFYACYSRETLAIPQPYEHAGYVQTLFTKLNPNPTSDIIYLCGNPGMIDQSFDYLKELGFDVKNIRREKYISSK